MIDAPTAPLEDNVFRKLTLAAGFGAGYVLGAKAGTQRYDQIMQKANELMGKPAVQDFTSSVSSSASAAADKAKSTVNDKVSSASGSSTSSSTDEIVVDLGTTTTPDTALGSPLGGTTSTSSIGSASTLGTSSPSTLGSSSPSTLGSSSTLGTGTTSGTSSTYGTTKPGAAPSDTAPDVL